MTICNAILISMEGRVAKPAYFCEFDANAIYEYLKASGQEAFVICLEAGVDAHQQYRSSALLRQRIAQAIQKVEIDTRIRTVLDGQGVPGDPELRKKFHAAFWELSCFSI